MTGELSYYQLTITPAVKLEWTVGGEPRKTDHDLPVQSDRRSLSSSNLDITVSCDLINVTIQCIGSYKNVKFATRNFTFKDIRTNLNKKCREKHLTKTRSSAVTETTVSPLSTTTTTSNPSCPPPSISNQLQLPSIELYNGTHRKVCFQNSFDYLPERYTAVLIELQTDLNHRLNVKMWKIENNFIKLEPCEVKEGSLFHVQIFPANIRNLNADTKPLALSKEFKYTPGNSVIKTLDQNICKVDRENVRVDIEAMKKNDEYFKYCFRKMEINDVTITNGMKNGKARTKDETTVRTTFYYRERPIFLAAKTEDLNVC